VIVAYLISTLLLTRLFVLSLFAAQEIYRAEPTRRRECLYYLALGHYKMGNYDEAKKFNGSHLSNLFPSFRPAEYTLSSGLLIDKEPTNMQALSLATLIENGVARGSSRLLPHPQLLISRLSLYRRLHRDGTSRGGSSNWCNSSGRSHTASSPQMIRLSSVQLIRDLRFCSCAFALSFDAHPLFVPRFHYPYHFYDARPISTLGYPSYNTRRPCKIYHEPSSITTLYNRSNN
jgi:hypothetical protein